MEARLLIGITSGMSPDAETPKVMDFCEHCGEGLRADYTFFEDNEGTRFCSQDCAIAHHEIEEKEWF